MNEVLCYEKRRLYKNEVTNEKDGDLSAIQVQNGAIDLSSCYNVALDKQFSWGSTVVTLATRIVGIIKGATHTNGAWNESILKQGEIFAGACVQ